MTAERQCGQRATLYIVVTTGVACGKSDNIWLKPHPIILRHPWATKNVASPWFLSIGRSVELID